MGGRAWRRDRGAEKPRDRGAQGPRNMEIAFVEARSGEKSVSLEELNAKQGHSCPQGMGAFKLVPDVLVSFPLNSVQLMPLNIGLTSTSQGKSAK